MPTFDSLIFDLDGTLWDTSMTCVRSWNSIVAKNGIEFREITLDDMHTITGRPHEECIRLTFAGLPEETLQFLIEETIVEDNRLVAEIGGRLYDGVDEGLRSLSKRYKLFIISNCQSGYIEAFLQWANFGVHVLDVECWGNTKRSKSENTASIIARNGLISPLFIGDTSGDHIAARDNNIPFAYLTHGFGKVEGADQTFDSFVDLTVWLTK